MALTLFGGASDPFFREMERTMNRVLDQTLGGRGVGELVPSVTGTTGAGVMDMPWRSFTTGMYHPMDIFEKEDRFEVVADAPGIKPEEINIEVDNGVMTIRGEHKESKEDKDTMGKVVRTERVSRSFTRSFTLPDNVKQDDICACLDNGVLKVCVPKVPEPERPKPKRIEVKGGMAPHQIEGRGAKTTTA